MIVQSFETAPPCQVLTAQHTLEMHPTCSVAGNLLDYPCAQSVLCDIGLQEGASQWVSRLDTSVGHSPGGFDGVGWKGLLGGKHQVTACTGHHSSWLPASPSPAAYEKVCATGIYGDKEVFGETSTSDFIRFCSESGNYPVFMT